MDMLLTAIAIALLCLAAWLLYKRYTNRYTPEAVQENYESEYEEEAPETQEAKATPAAPEPEAEAKKEA